MKISTRGRYGSRAMIELGAHYGDGPVMLRTIAANQALSMKYLEQILARLREAGLVRVVRGRGGGFVLARPPASIGLGEILRVLEGEVAVVDCVISHTVCNRSMGCVMRHVWGDLSRQISKFLDSVHLDTLVREAAAGRPETARGGRAGDGRSAVARRGPAVARSRRTARQPKPA